jgi:hypothetical protein
MFRRIAVSYFGGAVGAVVSSLALWIASRAGLTAMLGVTIAPELTWAWLEPRILWGGIFGLGYPLVRRYAMGPTRAGLALSLVPTAVAFFYFLPRDGQGLLGVTAGPVTPLVVLAANAIWGWTVARTVTAVGEKPAAR